MVCSVPSSLYSEVETSLMQSSQLNGTAKVVSNGGIMVELDLLCYAFLTQPAISQ